MGKFCNKCSQEKQEVTTGTYANIPGRYDEDTGLKIKRLQCVNVNCEEGCGYYGYEYNFWGCGNKCKRCGHVHCDY